MYIYIHIYIYVYIYIYIRMYQLISLHSCNYLKKFSVQINVVTDDGNTQNEI